VELVVNVDVPSQSRDYLHRAGRTGRAGATGLVLSLMTEAESRLAKRYAQDLDIALEQVQLVRGALVPATGDSAQNLRPAPRPFGPGRGGRKKTLATGPDARKEPTAAASTPPAPARTPQSRDKAGPAPARTRGSALPGAKPDTKSGAKPGQKPTSGPKRSKPA
jgi:superfamily II DNA/RNA helicase